MEQVHGVDVSWMTHGSPKEKTSRSINSRRASVSSQNSANRETPTAGATTNGNYSAESNATTTTITNGASTPKPIPSSRPGFTRSNSADKSATTNGGSPGSPSPQRRGSWFSNISSKFSSSNAQTNGSPPSMPAAGQPIETNSTATNNPSTQGAPASPPPVPYVPKITPAKNAVLQHATRHEGEGPYTPAPPRSGQGPSFLGVFRRLSSSSGGMLSPGVLKGGASANNHGLVERKVLNVDQHRERCQIAELNQSKLRRVAFCVDVEIAPMPKYTDADAATMATSKKLDKLMKQKMGKLNEKGEGDALKHSKSFEESKEADAAVKKVATEQAAKEVGEQKDATATTEECTEEDAAAAAALAAAQEKEQAACKRKEKKKKSEEERKARKEKKRKLAEANGTIPMEIYMDSSDSSGEGGPSLSSPTTPRTSAYPTTNPVRIYRRCCQLRETPILKKITEQLTSATNTSAAEPGVVQRLDLTGYWLQLPDLITLGDYLAVVPVKELLLENCGLTDEGLRVVLAGLLAAKLSASDLYQRRKQYHQQQVHLHGLGNPDGLTPQGGVVERLVLKNNKIGPEGWKHISLFTYLCRSLKQLDVSGIQFPRPPPPPAAPAAATTNGSSHHLPHIPHPSLHPTISASSISTTSTTSAPQPPNLALLFSKSLAHRLAGSELELLNLGETDPAPDQLGTIMDGIIACGVRRLGMAHNHLDATGVQHVARYLADRKCEGLDLGGNDLRDHMEMLAQSLGEEDPLWALSLADCNLIPRSLCKIFPRLVKLRDFRFIDLSHNHELFNTEPSSVSILRRYLPKMTSLKRIHLADVGMTSEEAISLAEILPEVKGLAHINLLENQELAKLADATTEDMQEEACALYASLLAATRVSKSIVCVDVDVPSDQSGEIVKAIAKQVVAYCLRNMERFPDAEINTAVSAAMAESQFIGHDPKLPSAYPDVLLHLVGHDVTNLDELETDADAAPDEDYVIGGTGVVKALACCLKNRGDESRRQSGEFIRDLEGGSGAGTPAAKPTAESVALRPGKAKDMSKHLLMSARRIRKRVQPALAKARLSPEDEHNLRKLMFLDQTLAGIIKRFEDEFPDTRVASPIPDSASVTATTPSTEISDATGAPLEHSSTSASANTDTEPYPEAAILSGDEDDTELHVRPLSRSNSILSTTSKALAAEEGRVLRAGHRFRNEIITQEHYDLLYNSLEAIDAEPHHARMLQEMIEELGDAELIAKMKEVGVLTTFQEERDRIVQKLREIDPDHWERFRESQVKAKANVNVAIPAANGTKQEEIAVSD